MAEDSKKGSAGDQLVKQQVISRADLDEAHRVEQESGTPWYRQLIQAKKLNIGSVSELLTYEFHSKAARQSDMGLGDTLVKMNVLTKKQLDEALAQQKRSGKLIGAVLVDSGMVTREHIARAFAAQYGLTFLDAAATPSRREALDSVPESMAKQRGFIPFKLDGDKLSVMISGSQSPERLKDAGIMLGKRIEAFMTSVENMKAEIEARYSGAATTQPKKTAQPIASTSAAAPALETKPTAKAKTAPNETAAPKTTKKNAATPAEEKTMPAVKESARFEQITRDAQGVPVIKLVGTIIEGAVNSGATDVHLDPQEPEMRVRYRIDGVLHDVMSIPSDIENAVVSRIKIMADVDITETRRPQDGHISMQIGEREFDVRVATLPTYLGERVVLRLLDQSSVLAGVKDLGLEKDDVAKLIRIIEQPYGMILVTGPTGSGKTTTLYSCLNQKNVLTDSIVTLEDPVEYQLSGINQVQIDADIDLTFANALRASLRQDIDVLLVGEIRDPDTARIAIRAAMTGHLVFSTLHTNDAPEAISTLRNMGVPSYLISSALTAVVAQRLVRRICPDCKTPFTPEKTLLKSLGLPDSTKKLFRGKGCANCYHTGTRGRCGIFEILELTPDIRKMIGADDTIDKITKASKLKTMSERCRQKVKDGQVAPEEFLRVIRT